MESSPGEITCQYKSITAKTSGLYMSNSMEYIHWGPVKCGLYKQVVFVYRWSLEQV